MIAECIQERRRTQGDRVVVEVWHVVAGPVDSEATWRPILCGGGIAFPGHAHMREPTCDDCLSGAPRDSRLTPEEGHDGTHS